MKNLKIIFTFLLLSGGIVLSAAEKKLPSMLEFGAKKCNACRKMVPIIAKLKKEYNGIIKVSFINVRLKENEKLAARHQIKLIPMQIFFDAKGRELWRHQGYISEKDILKKWQELGYDLAALKKAKE